MAEFEIVTEQPARGRRGRPPGSATKSKAGSSGATIGYEQQLWQMADALRGSMDAAEYKHVDGDVARIARSYHAWRGEADAGAYADVAGFCKSASLEEVRKHGHVLTPGRYVGAEAQADDGEPFYEKTKRLVAQLREQQAEAAKLDAAIAENLRRLGYPIEQDGT